MANWSVEDLQGKACAALNQHVLKQPEPMDRPAKRADLESAHDYLAEKKLQAECELFLESRGCRRLTAKNAGKNATGWFGHLFKPQGNPFMPDLFVFHEPNDRPALLVELKTRESFQPGQLEMCHRGAWTLVRSLDEFAKIYAHWSGNNKEQHEGENSQNQPV